MKPITSSFLIFCSSKPILEARWIKMSFRVLGKLRPDSFINLVPCAPSHFCPASDATQSVDVEPIVLTYASPFLPIAFHWVGPIFAKVLYLFFLSVEAKPAFSPLHFKN